MCLKVVLQKALVFFQPLNLARPSATAVANHRSLIILESEPYHARSMLREKQTKPKRGEINKNIYT